MVRAGAAQLLKSLGRPDAPAMNVGESVRKAIADWEQGEVEAAMLHACNAVDGTAKKVYPDRGSNQRFTTLIRESLAVFGPMALPGINLRDTRLPVRVAKPKAPGGQPDVADVIYGIHRCTHGHGDELPDGFDLLPDAAGPPRYTRAVIEEGKIRLSDRVIFGLLAVAVLSPVNADQVVPDPYYLTFDGERYPINEWWGRYDDFEKIVSSVKLPSVLMDFGDWMDS